MDYISMNGTAAHQCFFQKSMKLPFLTPHFYWLKLVLLLLISLCANKKGGSIKVVSLRFDVTTDEMSLLYLEQ